MQKGKCIYNSPVGIIQVNGDNNYIDVIKIAHDSENLHKTKKSFFEVRKCKRQLKEYFESGRKSFNFKFVLSGTELQNKIWNEAKNISYGKTVNFKDIALKLEENPSPISISNTMKKSQLAIIIPSHRVVSSNSKTISDANKWLIRHEKDNL